MVAAVGGDGGVVSTKNKKLDVLYKNVHYTKNTAQA